MLIKQEAMVENIKNDEEIALKDENSKVYLQAQYAHKRSIPIMGWQCFIGLILILLCAMIKYTTWLSFLQKPIKASLNQTIQVEEVLDFIDETKEISLKYWRMK